MDKRPSRDSWAMALAGLTADRSTCLRRRVGCVLLNERGHVLATGYNGVAAGLPHCNEPKLVLNPDLWEPYGDGPRRKFRKPEHWESEFLYEYPHACSGAGAPSGTQLDACQAIHAEQNALLQCRDVYDIHTCYVTASPCVTCTKLLLNTSCSRIIYAEAYPHTEAEALWVKAGREWIQHV